MGRVFRVVFEEPDYFICKNCGTHIALQESHMSNEDPEPPGVTEGLFITVFNVEVDKQHRPFSRNGDHTVANTYCVKCGDKLGFKYILTTIDGRTIKNELVQLRMNKLFLWNTDLQRRRNYYRTLRIGG